MGLSRYNSFLSNARSADNYLNRPALATGIGAAAAAVLTTNSKTHIDALSEAISEGNAADASVSAKDTLLNIRNALDEIRDENPVEGSELKNIEEALENHHRIMQDEALAADGAPATNKYLSMLHPSYFGADMCCINSSGNMYNIKNPEPWGTVPFDLMPANNVRYGFSFTPVFHHNKTIPYYTRRSSTDDEVNFADHQVAEVWWGIDINNLGICDTCLSMRDFMVNNNIIADERREEILEYVDSVIEIMAETDPEIIRLSGLVRENVVAIDKNGVEDILATITTKDDLQLAEEDYATQSENISDIYDSFKTSLKDQSKPFGEVIDEMNSHKETISDYVSFLNEFKGLYTHIVESPDLVMRPGEFSIALLELITVLEELIVGLGLDDLNALTEFPHVMLVTSDPESAEPFKFNGFFTTFINHDEKDVDRGIADDSYKARKPSLNADGETVYLDEADNSAYGKSAWGFRQKMEHVFPMDEQECIASACKWIRPMLCKDGVPQADSCLPGKLVIQLIKRKIKVPNTASEGQEPNNWKFIWDPDEPCDIDFSDAVMHCSMKLNTVYSYDVKDVISIKSVYILPYKKIVLANKVQKG